MTTEQRYWFVLYTRPFWEKKVEGLVKKLYAVEAWCPVRKVFRKWSDRIKKLDEPYFRSYVFVYASEKERVNVLNAGGVMGCVRFDGKPARVGDSEMEKLKAFVFGYRNVEVTNLTPGERVKICRGVFVEKEGIIQRINNNKASIIIPQLNCMLTADVDVLQAVEG